MDTVKAVASNAAVHFLFFMCVLPSFIIRFEQLMIVLLFKGTMVLI
jgi:hypothetical protein